MARIKFLGYEIEREELKILDTLTYFTYNR